MSSSRKGWNDLSPEIRNMIYKLVFLSDRHYESEYINIRGKNMLYVHFFRCCKSILAEAQPMLYGAITFHLNADYPAFIRRHGRSAGRDKLIRRVELDYQYINKARMRELERFEKLQALTLTVQHQIARDIPQGSSDAQYKAEGDYYIATYMHQLLQDMVKSRPSVTYRIEYPYWKTYHRQLFSAGRFWRWTVAWDEEQQAVKTVSCKYWTETTEWPVFGLKHNPFL